MQNKASIGQWEDAQSYGRKCDLEGGRDRWRNRCDIGNWEVLEIAGYIAAMGCFKRVTAMMSQSQRPAASPASSGTFQLKF